MSRATTSGPVSESRVFTGCFDSSARISGIGRVRSTCTTSSAEETDSFSSVVSGRYDAGSRSSSSRNTPSAVILPSACRSAEHETARATGHEAPCRGSRTTRTSWQKYLPPNCAPIPKLCVSSEDLLLELEVAEPVRVHRAGGRQVVEVVRGGVLRGLQRVLRRRAADDHRQVVRRAGGGPQRADLLVEELQHPLGVEHRLGLLEQERLVRGPAALGHEQELVGGVVGARRGVQLDLRRQVGAGVALLPHRQRRELGVAQVELGVGVVHALADPLGVVGAGEHALGLLAHHDGGAGVLAHRQHAAGGDVDVLEQVERDEPVVAAGLRVVDDPAQLREVRGAQVVRDVVHRLRRQQPQHRRARPAGTGGHRPRRCSRPPSSAAGTASGRRRWAAGRSSGSRRDRHSTQGPSGRGSAGEKRPGRA